MILKLLVVAFAVLMMGTTAFYSRMIAKKIREASVDRLTISHTNAYLLSRLFNTIAISLSFLAGCLTFLVFAFSIESRMMHPTWTLFEICAGLSAIQAWVFRETYERLNVVG